MGLVAFTGFRNFFYRLQLIASFEWSQYAVISSDERKRNDPVVPEVTPAWGQNTQSQLMNQEGTSYCK